MKTKTEPKSKRPHLLTYVREKDRRPVGVVVVYIANNGELRVGFSRCHTKDDVFSRDIGRNLAYKRAVPAADLHVQVAHLKMPLDVYEVALSLLEKARRYLANENKPREWKKKNSSRRPRKAKVEG